MESHMRSTNLKLEPIESGSFINAPNINTEKMPSQLNQSVVFQKGMLS